MNGMIRAGIIAVVTLAGIRAHAAPTLTLQTPCFNSVRIMADPGLTQDVATIDRSRGNLTFIATDRSAVMTGSRCDSDEDVTMRVRPGTDIVIIDGGSTDYAISGVGGALIATMRSGDLRDDHATSLQLHLTGSGDAQIAAVDGDVAIAGDSSGDVTIGNVEHAAAAQIVVRGSGDAAISRGQFDNLAAQSYSSGSITIHGIATNARIEAYGSGDIVLARATGQLSQRSLGSGSVTVYDTHGARISESDAGGGVGPIPPIPPMPAMPVFGSEHAGATTHTRGNISINDQGIFMPGIAITQNGIRITDSSAAGKTVGAAIGSLIAMTVFAVLLIVGIFLAPFAIRRWLRGKGPQLPPERDPRIERLMHDLARLEPRLGQMEQYVTSRDFNLRRELRALEK